jgi:parallel beta-helix repeat protein
MGGIFNSVQDNLIGTNAAGTAALGNAGDGVLDNGGFRDSVGNAGAGNTISGNGQNGVELDGTLYDSVRGNLIGTNAAGTATLGNAGDGVLIDGGSNDNTIGGTAAGAGNIIAYNGADGVAITSGTGNTVSQNSIFNNTGLGIDLSPGANNNLPAPTLSGATYSTTTMDTTVTGTLTGLTANTTYVIEFFMNPTNTDQGETYEGTTTVTTDSNGNASFSTVLTGKISKGQYITATNTDSGGDTSEFSSTQVVS